MLILLIYEQNIQLLNFSETWEGGGGVSKFRHWYSVNNKITFSLSKVLKKVDMLTLNILLWTI